MGRREEERLVGGSASVSPSPLPLFSPSPSRLAHLLAWVLACATLVLIGAGAFVTTYRAGMAVPDWPNTFGYNLFLYPLESWIDVFDVLLEHSHRLIAATVGLVGFALATVLWFADPRPAARRLGIAAAVGVSLQGTLGGLRVILDETLLADVHGCVAAMFFALAAAIVAYTSPAWREAGDGGRATGDGGESEKGRRGEGEKGSKKGATLVEHFASSAPLLPFSSSLLLPFAFWLQIVLGAQLRHLTPQQSPGWFSLWVWLHVIVAGLLVLAVVWLLVLTRRRTGAAPIVSRRAKWLAAVLAIQLVLAAATWVTHYGWPAWLTGSVGAISYTVIATGPLQAFTTTAHVVVGSLALGAAVSLTLWDSRQRVVGSRQYAVGRWQMADHPLPTAYCLLPTAYCQLIRPRILAMVLATIAVAALATASDIPAWPGLVHALVGSGLVIAGAIALNERAERWSDARMIRTALRPLPSGRVTAAQAGWFGAIASGLGLAYLGLLSDGLTVGLAAISWAVYVVLYTPMKTRSPWQTPLGALAGAMPVLLGVAAGGGRVTSVAAIAFFGVLYFWQFPHAMAIAWLYRDQFAAAGVKVASVVDPSGRAAAGLALAGAAALVPTSLAPWWAGTAGWGYGLAALVLGLGYAAASAAFWLRRDQPSARLLLRSSIVYLVGLLAAMLACRRW